MIWYQSKVRDGVFQQLDLIFERAGNRMEALRYLLHYYSNEEFLFQTVTMYPEESRDGVLDSLAKGKTWYRGRFAATDRSAYMRRRVAVETMLFTEFERAHWRLKSEHPVYFYLVPNLSRDTVNEELCERRKHGEDRTKYIIIDLNRIARGFDITFTLDDSLRSYRRKLVENGFKSRQMTGKVAELEDHGKVFHIDEIADVYKRNMEVPDLRFEIQVWDRQILFDYLAEEQC